MSQSVPPIHSPTLHSAGLAALEAVINRALALDPATRLRLGELSGHVFLLHCTRPELGIYLIPDPDGVRLCGTWEEAADTTLRGSATEFSRLLLADDPANALINGQLELHGDTQALIELQTIAHQLDIDWEAPLANLFGDVVGHQLGRGIRSGLRFGRQALTGLRRQFDEYLLEESELVAPRWQVERFFRDVDQLAMRTERLEARLRKLRQQRQVQP